MAVKKANNTTIVIDDGTREIPILNKFGQEICKIYIRPSDWSILDRYKAFMASFDDVVKPLEDVGIKADGTAQFEKDWEAIKGVEAEVKRRIDALLDTKCSDGIFATRNAFSIIGGRFYCEIILDAIGEIIERTLQEETAASAKRMNKYLSDDAKVKEK